MVHYGSLSEYYGIELNRILGIPIQLFERYLETDATATNDIIINHSYIRVVLMNTMLSYNTI